MKEEGWFAFNPFVNEEAVYAETIQRLGRFISQEISNN
jgi:hypothetical protein